MKLVRCGRTVVGCPFAVAFRVPGVNVDRAELQIERRCHAVPQTCFDAPGIARAVMMRVDEAGANDVPGRIDRLRTRYVVFRDADDHAALDADVSHRIEVGLRVHHPTVENHDVIGLLGPAVATTGEDTGQYAEGGERCDPKPLIQMKH